MELGLGISKAGSKMALAKHPGDRVGKDRGASELGWKEPGWRARERTE